MKLNENLTLLLLNSDRGSSEGQRGVHVLCSNTAETSAIYLRSSACISAIDGGSARRAFVDLKCANLHLSVFYSNWSVVERQKAEGTLQVLLIQVIPATVGSVVVRKNEVDIFMFALLRLNQCVHIIKIKHIPLRSQIS